MQPLPQSCMEEARPTDVVRIEVEGSLGGYVSMKVVPVQGRVGYLLMHFLRS